jgi:hypothetical protein
MIAQIRPLSSSLSGPQAADGQLVIGRGDPPL